VTRQAADRLLRMLMLSTVIGVVVIVIVALLVPDQRGLFLLIGAVYLVTSLAAWFTIRRSLNREVARAERRQIEGD
jgi:uncharacterized membrane protein YqjE